jgi:hypothetical protein
MTDETCPCAQQRNSQARNNDSSGYPAPSSQLSQNNNFAKLASKLIDSAYFENDSPQYFA